MVNTAKIKESYQLARERYASLGVETDRALEKMGNVSLSLHCWQGDDLGGFEKQGSRLSGGGLQVTGSYPGRASTVDELRMDLNKAYSLIPGFHRLNLHAIYGEFGEKHIERNEIGPEHFKGWVDWAKHENLKLDFNSTCFSHPRADSGFTLSSKDRAIREFWLEHVMRCRAISAFMGRELESPSIHNLWIPDGSKDAPFDRFALRALLREALDRIFSERYSPREMKDAVESKLFGIGSESYVVGSHEFYMGYALTRNIMLCLDLGHFHPTESIADKLSAILQFSDELLLHISRGVRWDSDHVVILNDELRSIAEEVVRGGFLERVHLALDFFDASLNRVGAWVIGARAVLKSLLLALLEPQEKLREFEERSNFFARLALMEEAKTMPFGSVWDYYCLKKDVPAGDSWMEEVKQYEEQVLSRRR